MPIIVAQQIKREYVNQNFNDTIYREFFLIEGREIGKKYGHIVTKGSKANVFISRIFNENFDVSEEPRLFTSLDILKAELNESTPHVYGYYLNFEILVHKLCIPEGYFAEVLVTSIKNGEYGEKVIFPNETKLDILKTLEDKVKQKMGALSKISTISQSHSLLSALGLSDIAIELGVGYSRFEVGDYDGACEIQS